MKNLKISLIILAASLLLGACGSNSSGADAAAKGDTSSTTAAAAKLEVKDSRGTVSVPANPQRVVVFDNGSLDTLDALGVGDRIVGAATSSLPAYLSAYSDTESAGGIKEPDLEKINELKPDLIIISGRQTDYLEQLQAIAPTLYLTVDNTDAWNSIQHNITVLAQIFDKTAEAKTQIAALQTQIDTLKEKAGASNAKALVVLLNEGSLSAYGAGSRFGLIHDIFGFEQADETIEAATHGQSISYEYVLEKNPAILFVVDRTKAIGGDTSQNTLLEHELIKETTAGKNGRVIDLQPDIWYLSGGGLESIAKMLEDASQAVD